jgi:hypothetical protein
MEKDEDEKMSSQGFRGIPGVPEGWELVGFRKLMFEDWYVGVLGKPERWQQSSASVNVYGVIRKIELPKQYRPFANAEEFKPHRDRWVRIFSGDNSCGCDIDEADIGGERSIDGCNEYSVCIWEGWMTYMDAFECFNFDDGTPFGVEVTSE